MTLGGTDVSEEFDVEFVTVTGSVSLDGQPLAETPERTHRGWITIDLGQPTVPVIGPAQYTFDLIPGVQPRVQYTCQLHWCDVFEGDYRVLGPVDFRAAGP